MSGIRPDPARSRIVLVGTPAYRDDDLKDVPEITRNIADLAKALRDPQIGSFEHCVKAPPRADMAKIGSLLETAASEAEDLLLFYYSGHGLLGANGELYLSLASTRPKSAQLAFTALPFTAVSEAFRDSKAKARVIILDCCFSGRATGVSLGNGGEEILEQVRVAGAYTLTSAPDNRVAVVRPGEHHTAFTERLLRLIRDGSPQAGDMLSLGDIFRDLHTQMLAEGLPEPQQRNTQTAEQLGLVRNRFRAGHPATRPAPVTPPEPPTQPEPPPARPKAGRWIRPAMAAGIAVVLAAAVFLLSAARDHRPPRVVTALRLAATVTDPSPSMVNAVTFSPDGKTLATVDNDGRAYLWNAASHTRLAAFTDPSGQGILKVAFSPDGKTLATVDNDGRAYLWNITSHIQVATLTGPSQKGVDSVAFSPNGKTLALVSGNGRAYLWNTASHTRIATFTEPSGQWAGSSRSARTARPSPSSVATAARTCGTSPATPRSLPSTGHQEAQSTR